MEIGREERIPVVMLLAVSLTSSQALSLIPKYCQTCSSVKRRIGKQVPGFFYLYERHVSECEYISCNGDGGMRGALEAARQPELPI
jgi:hypothetical protein